MTPTTSSMAPRQGVLENQEGKAGTAALPLSCLVQRPVRIQAVMLSG